MPTTTGATAAIGLVIPETAGRLDGLALKVGEEIILLTDFDAAGQRMARRVSEFLERRGKSPHLNIKIFH